MVIVVKCLFVINHSFFTIKHKETRFLPSICVGIGCSCFFKSEVDLGPIESRRMKMAAIKADRFTLKIDPLYGFRAYFIDLKGHISHLNDEMILEPTIVS